MKILALDLATTTGWAFLTDGKLIDYGIIKIELKDSNKNYPYNYTDCAKAIGYLCNILAGEKSPDHIVIEETNRQGKFGSRYSQKILEFIHFAVVEALSIPVNYMDTREWRKFAQVSISSEQRKQNRELTLAKREALHKTTLQHKIELAKKIAPKASNMGPKAKDLLRRKIEKKAIELAKVEMRKVKGLQLGKSAKVTFKHVSVSRANELFNTNFKMKDDDIADATLLGWGYYLKIRNKRSPNAN